MTKNERPNRTTLQSRQRKFSVHVSKCRVAANVVVISAMSLMIGGIGVRHAVLRSPVLGAILVLGGCLFFYIFGYLWIRDINKTVLVIETEGIRYYKQFVAWSEISDIEIIRRPKTPDKLLLTLNSGKTITIFDDLLSMSMDDMHYHIKKRI